MKKRLLFVDDEPNLLQGLRRMLRPMRHEWDMAFAESGQQALELLAQAPFDVVVTDMLMPGMNGVQLLTQVMEHYPHTIRLVLSGHHGLDLSLKTAGLVHQCLAKPCDPELLKSTIARACNPHGLLNDTALRALVSGLKTLPSLPQLYLEVMQVAQAPDGSFEKVGEVIGRDISMTTKILQLVNSAFFGRPQQISSPAQAVSYLGLDTVKELILSVQIFTHFDQSQLRELSLDDVWQHSMAASACAKHIARAENNDRTGVEHAMLAGLLHDVGKLVLAANLPEPYGQTLTLAREQGLADWEAEHEVLGTTHAEIGGYLLGLWGLLDPIVEAVVFHHRPSACPNQTFSPLTAVHVANALMSEANTMDPAETSLPIDLEYLAALGLSDRLAVWREHCQTVLTEAPHT